ncbi:hypothetical protein BH09MYX1_BH09MYX1_42250 [soil metagenome]
MSRPSKRIAIFVCLSLSVPITACTHYPTVTPANGTEGAYVRAIAGDVRAGVVAAPLPGATVGWPPSMNVDPASPCSDEVARIQSSLGVASVGCPMQRAEVTAGTQDGVADGDAPITPGGFNLKCYDLGGTILVVEHTETLAPKHCTHVVGLAVFHAGSK